MKRFQKWILPVLTLLSLAFIFSNSLESQTKAEEKRQEVVSVVQNVAGSVTGETRIIAQRGRVFLSKSFHVSEFCLFSFFLSLQVITGGRARGYESVLLCGVFCALADEQLQIISDGRGSRLSDVLVDLAGVILGYALAYFVLAVKNRRKKHE